MAVKTSVDPIIVAVLDNQFSAIAEEMAKVLIRTSRSPIFAEARDFAVALFDRHVKEITQKDYIPGMASCLPISVRSMVKTWENDVNEGDVFISNDQYNGNMHLPDVTLLKPVFYKGQLIYWAGMTGHMVDIGGRAIVGYDPSARSVHEEGLIIPCSKLYDRGTPNKSVWQLILRNVKFADLFDGDLRGMVGALTTGERRLIELAERYNSEVQQAAINEIIDSTARDIKNKIRQIPDGVYYGEKSGDHDAINRDKPIRVRVKVIKKADEITIDLSESDNQCNSYVNCSWGNTFTACHQAIFYVLPGEVKRNEGSMDPIKVIARKGSCVNPIYPAPAGGNYPMTPLILEAICLALAPVIPQWVTAGHGIPNGDSISGFNPRTKTSFSFLDFISNSTGSGGTEGYDGWDLTGPAFNMGQMRIPDPEIMELALPIHILQYEPAVGSEGKGKFRGGHGVAIKYQYLAEIKAVLFGLGMQDFATPSGLFGGGNGKVAETVLIKTNGEKEKLDVATYFSAKAGDIFLNRTQGGAGFGSPLDRDPEQVQKDVKDEWISIEEAREQYGVTINPQTLEVDLLATEKLRHKK
jgi:N-methylhydantoinase B